MNENQLTTLHKEIDLIEGAIERMTRNSFMIKQDGSSEVQVFSDCHLGEFPNDDYRK